MAKKKTSNAAIMPTYHEPKSVRVEKASNGFVVTHHGPTGCKVISLKT